jgi:hypothetical protein
VWQIGGHYQGGILLSNFVATMLLDVYPNAGAAYGFRKLRAAYGGSAVRIRESGSNGEADIGFTAGGDFDTAAAATHIGANTGFIVTWYDQSGNGLDITQATAANQPTYSASGLLSLPTASFDGADHLQRAAVDFSDFCSGDDLTLMSVMYQNSADAQNSIFGWNSSDASNTIRCFLSFEDILYLDIGDDQDGGAGGRTSNTQPGGWDDAGHIAELYRDSGGNQGIVVDGTLAEATESRAATATTASGVFSVGSNGQAGSETFHTGFISEFVIWYNDLDTNRSGARTHMNDYYGAF